MIKILLCILCIFGYIQYLGAYDIKHITEIQKYGKTDICHIGMIDDGDTFDLDCHNGYYPDVRLIGVNTPDYDHHTEGGKCYYDEAKKYISERKKRTYDVTFYGNDLCKDPFKGCRNLVQLIDNENHTDMGQMMILRGFAFSWTNFSRISDNMRKIYNRMEVLSSDNQLGLWSQCHIISTPIKGVDSSIPGKMTSSHINSNN